MEQTLIELPIIFFRKLPVGITLGKIRFMPLQLREIGFHIYFKIAQEYTNFIHILKIQIPIPLFLCALP